MVAAAVPWRCQRPPRGLPGRRTMPRASPPRGRKALIPPIHQEVNSWVTRRRARASSSKSPRRPRKPPRTKSSAARVGVLHALKAVPPHVGGAALFYVPRDRSARWGMATKGRACMAGWIVIAVMLVGLVVVAIGRVVLGRGGSASVVSVAVA